MSVNAYAEQYYENMALADFDSARRRAFWNGLTGWLKRRENRLRSLADALGKLRFSPRDLGVMAVCLNAIVGTVERNRDFDRDFMPRQDHTRHRWLSVASAHYKGTALPPVDLYKVGDAYFVADGHHRLSVARLHGMSYIDAHVYEIPDADGRLAAGYPTC